ncbi:DUF881 domain-containing protein [Cellulomonas sp. KRMCY2]|uniref:DUF881 domain-containing protein n=1 Tax=Cellulomonas sp. KRMCY2 TaxID=1304865 RepID=UPI00045E5EF0|nr:DUF881 domain-containing protein [Cellulomonas sp. KRMCY2]
MTEPDGPEPDGTEPDAVEPEVAEPEVVDRGAGSGRTPRSTSRRAGGTDHGSHAAPALDASMGLLYEVMYRPVDPGYAEAAARVEPVLAPGALARRTGGYLLVGVALGVVTMAAVLSLRTPEPAALESRSLLESEVADRAADAEALAQSNAAVAEEIAALQSDALAAANPGLFADLQEAELLSGALAVTGPGLVIELRDPELGAATVVDPDARVQDLDLQILTNGLWAAGAEAIAINGQRLTALSAIRGNGPAILVDLAPLLPPYRVEAIGDVRPMQTDFARSTAANHLSMLSGTYGIAVTTRADSALELPAGGATVLRYASTGDVADVASSVPADQEGKQ